MGNPNPNEKSRFTAERQPQKRGRLKSIFGPLAKENNLSLDDVRKIYKNILTAKGPESLNSVKEKYPSVFTNMTIDQLKQDMFGRLTGRKITVIDPKTDTPKEIDERIKSYETVEYMLDRIFGVPAKIDLSVSGSVEMDVTAMSREDRKSLIDNLLKDYHAG